MPDEYLTLEECKTEADLERLGPRAYSDLAGRQATMLDVVRLQLGAADALRLLGDRIAGLEGRLDGARPER